MHPLLLFLCAFVISNRPLIFFLTVTLRYGIICYNDVIVLILQVHWTQPTLASERMVGVQPFICHNTMQQEHWWKGPWNLYTAYFPKTLRSVEGAVLRDPGQKVALVNQSPLLAGPEVAQSATVRAELQSNFNHLFDFGRIISPKFFPRGQRC